MSVVLIRIFPCTVFTQKKLKHNIPCVSLPFLIKWHIVIINLSFLISYHLIRQRTLGILCLLPKTKLNCTIWTKLSLQKHCNINANNGLSKRTYETEKVKTYLASCKCLIACLLHFFLISNVKTFCAFHIDWSALHYFSCCLFTLKH